MRNIYRLFYLTLIVSCTQVTAVENYPDSHSHNHKHKHEDIKEHTSNDAVSNIKIYSCDLRSYSNQCREYSILASAKDTFNELKSGCESMKGSFNQSTCPVDNIIASCTDIVRNYHKPDVIYDNFYYQGKPSSWTKDVIVRVCGDLGGELD
jgi:hypothetical protein